MSTRTENLLMNVARQVVGAYLYKVESIKGDLVAVTGTAVLTPSELSSLRNLINDKER